jgi:ubiquinone/menaquinone biosynthesis C-methylase UbiE
MDDDVEVEVETLLAEQVAYYRARAPEYDEVYAGKEQWDQFIDELPITGDVLELACGTGRWTSLLAARARSVTAVDAAPEMLALARQRVRDRSVEFVVADVFGWQPPRRYDTVFFAFWLTHVPPARFAAFWSTVGAALASGGRACFVDTSHREREHERVLPGQSTPIVRRRLRDGSQHRVVKVFDSPAELAARLAELGWSARIREVGATFLAGYAQPAQPPKGSEFLSGRGTGPAQTT